MCWPAGSGSVWGDWAMMVQNYSSLSHHGVSASFQSLSIKPSVSHSDGQSEPKGSVQVPAIEKIHFSTGASCKASREVAADF